MSLVPSAGRWRLSFLISLVLLCVPVRGSEAANRSQPSGPVYVPLDEWIYPAFRRLSSLGYVPDLDHLVAPWPRSECLVLLQEAEEFASRYDLKTSAPSTNAEANKLLKDLHAYFLPYQGNVLAPDKMQLRVESVYSRVVPVFGTPLNDSYHFGQTLANDYGRPYGSGTSSVVGLSASGVVGRWSGYVRGEWQRGASIEPYSSELIQTLATVDGVRSLSLPSNRTGSRADALEAYVGVHLGKFNITAGKQSSWWGPGAASAFAFTNNAEPIYSVKLAQETPIVLPGPFRYLGHIRTEFLVGRLTGNTSPPKPYINAQKITFQLTENLEVGFTRSALFGGVGHPLTAGSILQSFFSGSSTGATSFGTSSDPGDRRSGFDFWWRVPGLRRYATFYSDSLADDEPNPLSNPKRSAWAPGLYLPRFIRSNLDLRLETYSTWLYRQDEGGRFLYWNTQYRDAYTNDGNLIGTSVGRDARAYMVSSSYWRSATNKITASYRQTKTGSNFLQGGGTQTDISLNGQWALTTDLIGNVFVQWERTYFPLLGQPSTNETVGFSLTLYPKRLAFAR